MSQTTRQDDAIDIPTSPTDIMLTLITGILSPLFLAGCDGIPEHGGMAAMEALNTYGVRTQAELLIVSKIVAFGLAALDDLRLSMHPDVGLAQKIRLRAQANALNRSAQQNEAALAAYRKRNPVCEPSIAEQLAQLDREEDAAWTEQDAREEAEVQAVMAETQRMVDAAQARVRTARQASAQAAPPRAAPPRAAPPRADWAASMHRVAGELQEDLPAQPRSARKANRMRIDALSSAAQALSGTEPPAAGPSSRR
jgi:hypothetical protein